MGKYKLLIKNTFLILIISSLICSCSENSDELRELNISAEVLSKSMAIGSNAVPRVYPNPFKDQVSISFSDSVKFVLNINANDAFKMFERSGRFVMLDFSDEKSGVYNCEILVNDKVYRTLLIKEE